MALCIDVFNKQKKRIWFNLIDENCDPLQIPLSIKYVLPKQTNNDRK